MFLAVLITAVVFWAVSLILVQFDEDYVLYWACGLLYPIALAVLSAIRAIKKHIAKR